jgi:hypothetical protein
MKPLFLFPLLLGCVAAPAVAGSCKKIHADLIEVSATEGCNPGLSSCFLGEVDGNHGLRGTTHFAADSARAGPATSPSFISYSGSFEYRTASGTLTMRETGVTTNGSEGVVTAYQEIVHGSGLYAGASGHLFVSGHKSGGMIDTFVKGEICHP